MSQAGEVIYFVLQTVYESSESVGVPYVAKQIMDVMVESSIKHTNVEDKGAYKTMRVTGRNICAPSAPGNRP